MLVYGPQSWAAPAITIMPSSVLLLKSPVTMSAREAVIYILVAISSMLMISYTVHMFVGGLVSDRSEHAIMAVAVGLWACVIAALAWDVVRRRRTR